jgi:hypothetical protein
LSRAGIKRHRLCIRFAKKVDRDALGYARHSLPPTRSECDVGEPVTEPTISSRRYVPVVRCPHLAGRHWGVQLLVELTQRL